MDDKLTKKQRSYVRTIIIGIVLLLVAIVLIVLFFLRGETIVSGEWPDSENTVSATCVSGELNYPFFEINEAINRNMNIKIVASDEEVTTIALTYKLYYNDDVAKTQSRDRNHYAVNMAFNKDNMEADSLGAHYSLLSDNFKFSIFAMTEEINDAIAKYFLLDKIEKVKYIDIINAYKSQGFSCIVDGGE